jgi:hypothetical protein
MAAGNVVNAVPVPEQQQQQSAPPAPSVTMVKPVTLSLHTQATLGIFAGAFIGYLITNPVMAAWMEKHLLVGALLGAGYSAYNAAMSYAKANNS